MEHKNGGGHFAPHYLINIYLFSTAMVKLRLYASTRILHTTCIQMENMIIWSWILSQTTRGFPSKC